MFTQCVHQSAVRGIKLSDTALYCCMSHILITVKYTILLTEEICSNVHRLISPRFIVNYLSFHHKYLCRQHRVRQYFIERNYVPPEHK